MCKRVLVVSKRHRERGGQLLRLLALSLDLWEAPVLSDTGENLLSLLRDKMQPAWGAEAPILGHLEGWVGTGVRPLNHFHVSHAQEERTVRVFLHRDMRRKARQEL